MGTIKIIIGVVLLTLMSISSAHAQHSFAGYSLDQLKTELSEAQIYQALGKAKTSADGPRGCYRYNDEMLRQRQTLIDLKAAYEGRANSAYHQKRAQAQEQFRLAERSHGDCYASALADYPVLSYAGVRTQTDFKAKVRALNPKYSAKGDIANYIAAIEDAIENIGNQRGKKIGVIESIFKQVDVLPGGQGQWVGLAKGSPIYIKDELKTGPRGRVRIKFIDHYAAGNAGPTVVNIGSSSHVKIEKFLVSFNNPPKSEGVIRLLRGSVRAFTKNWGPRSSFTVRAGASVCGIRGTEVAVSYDPATDVAVHTLNHGDAYVEADGQRVTLKPRTSVSVRGSRISALRNISDVTWSGIVSSTGAGYSESEQTTRANLPTNQEVTPVAPPRDPSDLAGTGDTTDWAAIMATMNDPHLVQMTIIATLTAQAYIDAGNAGDERATLALTSQDVRAMLVEDLKTQSLSEIIATQGNIRDIRSRCGACRQMPNGTFTCLVKVNIDLYNNPDPRVVLFGVVMDSAGNDATVAQTGLAEGEWLHRYESYGPICRGMWSQ